MVAGRACLLDGGTTGNMRPAIGRRTRMDSITITTGTYNKINKLLSLVGKTSESGKTSLTLGATYDKESVVAKIYANQKISEEMLTEFKKNVKISNERKEVSEIIEVIA